MVGVQRGGRGGKEKREARSEGGGGNACKDAIVSANPPSSDVLNVIERTLKCLNDISLTN